MKARHLPLLLAAVAPLHATESAGRWFDHAVERSWIENHDSTLVTRRVLTELNFEDRGGDDGIWKIENSFRWGVPLHEGLALGFQAMVPVKWQESTADEGTHDVSQLELKFPVVLKLSDRWSGALTYKPRWDLLAESDRHRLELGATRTLGADPQYALSFAVELPLVSESFDSKLTAGLAWHF